MDSYIDIHSHILPGLDDGARDIEMSMRMLRLAADEGIQKIILTPHYKPMRRNPDIAFVRDSMDELKRQMEKEQIAIKLHLGNEVYYSSEVLAAMRDGKIFTMAGSSYVLVEFNPMEDYAYIRDGVYRLMSEGYYPILAHVERYSHLMKKKERVAELKDMGCLIQVNAASIVGDYGRQAKQDVKRLLKDRQVHFAATDCHDDRDRIPTLKAAAEYVCKKYGNDYCDSLFRTNAEKILRNEYI